MIAYLPALSWLLLSTQARDDESIALPPPVVEEAWTISAGVWAFDPPGEDVYFSPIVRADRGALHLEARYNYEERDTASVFVGHNFSLGDELTLDLTPMLGVVMGEIDGVAPGLELELAWKGLALASETEYVIDFEEAGEDFLYTWSELTFAPADWVRFGLVGQRTRLFEQELEVDRGLLLGFAAGAVWLDLFLFNPDGDDPYGGFALGVDL